MMNGINAFLTKICPNVDESDIQPYPPNLCLVVRADENTHETLNELLKLIRSTHPETVKELRAEANKGILQERVENVSYAKEIPIAKNDDSPIKMKVLPVENRSAEGILEVILQVFPELQECSSAGLRVAVDPHTNSLILMSLNPEYEKSLDEIINIVEALVSQLDKKSGKWEGDGME
jgi:hypothetical protein